MKTLLLGLLVVPYFAFGQPPVVFVTANQTTICQGSTAQLTATVMATPTTTGTLNPQDGGGQITCDCPSGYVAVGFSGRKGDVLDQLTLACKKLNPDGSLDPTVVFTNSGGGNGGAPFGPVIFSNGTGLVGARLSFGTDEYYQNSAVGITGYGQPLSRIRASSPNSASSVALNTITGSYTAKYAGTVYVPNGHIVTGMTIVNVVIDSSFVGSLALRSVPIRSIPTMINWSTGQTDPSITVNPGQTKTYTATATNDFGTSGPASLTISVDPLPTVTITPASASICAGQSTTLTANPTTGLTYRWSTEATTPSISVSLAGPYSLTATSTTTGCSNTASVNLTVAPQSPDYQALVDLYKATNGANWINHNNWLTGCTPCGWYGVTCDNSGRVTSLDLHNNQLSGSIPASLSALTNLQYLVLYSNQLSGSIPASLSALTNLVSLYLSDNQLSGPISPSLSALTNLKILILSGNPLGGTIPASLSALTNLENLNLSFNQLSGPVPPSLSALTNLQELILDHNQLSGCLPASLSAFCGKNVDVSGNPSLPGEGDFAAFCQNKAGSDGFRPLATASPNPACPGSPVSLSVSAGTSYQWSGPASFQATTQTPSFTPTSTASSGLYSVTVGNGSPTCTATTTLSLTVNPQPTLTVSGPLTCAQPQVILTASGGRSYIFANGSGILGTGPTNTLVVGSPGTYSVTVTSANGCQSSTSVTVSQNATPPQTVTLANNGPLSANNTPVTLTASSSTGGVSYAFSPGAAQQGSTNKATVTSAGTFTVTVTRPDNGCSTKATTTVFGANSPTVCRGANATINLVVPGNPTRYEWYQVLPIGLPLLNLPFVYQGATTANLTILNVQLGNVYYARVYYADGSSGTYGPFRVTVNYSCSGRIAAVEPGSELRLGVLGNPLTGEVLRAQVEGVEGQPLRVELVDLSGRSMKAQSWASAEGQQVLEWSASGWPAGVYVLQAVSGQQRQSVKLIKP